MTTLWTAGRGYALLFAITAHRPQPSPLWYVLGMTVIILAHEFGHWGAARWLNARVGWPMLLPLPIGVSAWLGTHILPPVGTLGALTPLQMPPAAVDRWRIAVAGILAGLGAALVVLLVGHALSPLGPSLGRPHTPWLVRAVLGSGRVWHPLAIAGWLGIMMTGANTIPLPILDGWWIWKDLERLPEPYVYATVALGGMGWLCWVS